MEMEHGHGVAGRYCGLPDPYGSQEFAKIVVLPVPFDKTTTYQKGTDKGPEALIEASRNMELYDIETDFQVYLNGIYTADAIQGETSEEMIEIVYSRVRELLLENKFVVTIGGEHAVSYAPIKAHAEHFSGLTVLQFDAHADLQPAYENNLWSHASVMARVKEIPQISKVVSVGIRSISHEELPLLNREDVFFAHQLQGKWMDKVMEKLHGPVYITFDLDAFDSSLMPSTGTPEPGGLFWNEAAALLKRVAEEKEIVGCDVVELCPNPFNRAPDYLAAKLIYKILSYQFKE